MKNLKKLLCLVMVCVMICPMFMTRADAANPTAGDLLRFVATEINITTSATTVTGYFINLIPNKSVSNFTEFDMDVYYDGVQVLSAQFGTINQFTIEPMSVYRQSFTFNGDYTSVLADCGYEIGDHVADEFFYITWGCSFTTTSK